MQQKIQKITTKLHDYCQQNGFQKAVIGLSGGVDSALTTYLGVQALGKANVFGLILPHKGVSDPQNVKDAENLAKQLGINYQIIPINEFEKPFEKLHWGHEGIAEMNIKARLRMNILYHWANTHDAIVLGTGNKTEETLGYFTKWGDGAVDILPIGDLYKTEVWQMAREVGIPAEIVEKTPTAELKQTQTDEGEIGMSYSEMDRILQKFESGGQAETENEKALKKRIEKNAHKTKMPPVIKS